MDKLALLALAKEFDVKGVDGNYEVVDRKSDLLAYIPRRGGDLEGVDTVQFYVSGVYNSGMDCVQFDVERLDKLRAFCDLMQDE